MPVSPATKYILIELNVKMSGLNFGRPSQGKEPSKISVSHLDQLNSFIVLWLHRFTPFLIFSSILLRTLFFHTTKIIVLD